MLAQRLVAQGCEALASVGTAGGLDPALSSGTIVIAAAIVMPDGTRLASDASWRTSLAALLAAGGTPCRMSSIAGCAAAIAGPGAKRDLFAATGAACCDMESHAVAEVAQASGIRFLALRAVADTSAHTLPLAALMSVRTDGTLRYGTLFGALLRQPSDVPGMIRLAAASRKALSSLRRVASLGGPLLGLPLA